MERWNELARQGKLEALKEEAELNSLSVNQSDYQGNTILHYAVQGGNLGVVQYLLGVGANPKKKNFHGLYPADYLSTCCGVSYDQWELAGALATAALPNRTHRP